MSKKAVEYPMDRGKLKGQNYDPYAKSRKEHDKKFEEQMKHAKFPEFQREARERALEKEAEKYSK